MTSTVSATASAARAVIDAYRDSPTGLAALSPAVRVHSPLRDEPFVGHAGFREYTALIAQAFPDAHFDIRETVADDATAAVRWVMEGTHRGPLGALPGSGRRVSVPALQLFRFDDDGRVSEIVTELDSVGVLAQIGVIPDAPESTGASPPAPARWLLALRIAYVRLRDRRRGRAAIAPPTVGLDPRSGPDVHERAREVVRRYLDGNDFSDTSLIAPDLELHTHARPEPFVGPDGLREFMGGIRRGFPDARFTVETVVGDGDTAVVRWVMRATNLGVLGAVGAPPSGRRVTIPALELMRFDQDGRVREVRLEMNTLSILRQIGVVPDPFPRPLLRLIARRLRKGNRQAEA